MTWPTWVFDPAVWAVAALTTTALAALFGWLYVRARNEARRWRHPRPRLTWHVDLRSHAGREQRRPALYDQDAEHT